LEASAAVAAVQVSAGTPGSSRVRSGLMICHVFPAGPPVRNTTCEAKYTHMLVGRRKHQRQRPRAPVLRPHAQASGRHLLHLLVAKILPRDSPSIRHSRIQRGPARCYPFSSPRLHRPANHENSANDSCSGSASLRSRLSLPARRTPSMESDGPVIT